MLLIRLAYAAELPATAELVKKAQQAQSAPSMITPGASPRKLDTSPPPAGTPRMQAALAVKSQAHDGPADNLPPATTLADFRAIVALVAEKRDIKLKTDLERFVRPVSMSPGKLEIALEPKAPQGLAGELSRKLEGWTGRRWMVLISREAGEPTLAEQDARQRNSVLHSARNNEVVKAILARFPNAEIKEVREPQAEDFANSMSEDMSADMPAEDREDG
jgi:DNA polymerase-3 subunit gamma/tau